MMVLHTGVGPAPLIVRRHSETPVETGERAAGDWGRQVQCVGRTSIIHRANTMEGGRQSRGDASTTESLIIAIVCQRRPRRSGPETSFDDLPGVVRLRAR